MAANIHPQTGIAYGYISANALDPEVVDQLIYGPQAVNVSYDYALKEYLDKERATDDSQYYDEDGEFDEDAATEMFNDTFAADEEIHQGKIEVPGYGEVEYSTSWLGGALNVWIIKSPFMTDKARRASPCVPNAGILDTLDGDVTSYDVPADWRYQE